MLKNQTFGLSEPDFTTVRHPKGSDFTLSVQVKVHPGLRDYDQSFLLSPKSPKVGFYFVAMDDATRLAFVTCICNT